MQDAPAARTLGLSEQLLVCVNRPEPILILERVMSLLSVFVTVTFWDPLVVPTGTLLNETDVGENKSVPTVPVPDSRTVCVRLGASSTIFNEFVRVPWAKGRNCTEIVQEAPAATVDGLIGHVVLETMKSEPTGMEMLEIVSEIDWVFVTLTDFTPDVCPSCTDAHDRLAGESVTSCAEAEGRQDTDARNVHSPAK